MLTEKYINSEAYKKFLAQITPIPKIKSKPGRPPGPEIVITDEVIARRREKYRIQRRKRDKYKYGLLQKRYKHKYPEKHRAIVKLNRAIKNGKLKRGNCLVCDRANAQAHHPDYSKPLDVMWLCPVHHVAEHRRLRENTCKVE